MGIALQKLDVLALHKLLKLAKSLDVVLEKSQDKAINQVLVRTTQDGELTFQAKGGSLWRLLNITLPGRQKEYDLAQNFRNVQGLFKSIEGFSVDEIRRASHSIEIAADVNVAKGDVISSLSKLHHTLNSIIDLVKDKKASKEADDTRKQSIIDAFEKMKIKWTVHQTKTSIFTSQKDVQSDDQFINTAVRHDEKAHKEPKRAYIKKAHAQEKENKELVEDVSRPHNIENTVCDQVKAVCETPQDGAQFEAQVLEVYAELQKISRELTTKARSENEFERAYYEGKRKRVQQLQRSIAHLKNELAQKLPINMKNAFNKLSLVIQSLSALSKIPDSVTHVAKTALSFQDVARSHLEPIHAQFAQLQSQALGSDTLLAQESKIDLEKRCAQFKMILDGDLSAFEQLKNLLTEYGRTDSEDTLRKIHDFIEEKAKSNSKEYLISELQGLSRLIQSYSTQLDDTLKPKSVKRTSRKKEQMVESK